jgi:hypothetical protein
MTKIVRKSYFKQLLIIVFIMMSVFAYGQVKVIKCYPNPATSIINFEFPTRIDRSYTLQIYSFTGKKMTELSASNKLSVMLNNDFYRGLYIYQLHDKTGKIVETGKFQVVK